MHNPTYLTLSRHNVYYFRFPMPQAWGSNSDTIRLSLRTREPLKALQLAKALSYYGQIVSNDPRLGGMSFSEAKALLSNYFAALLKDVMAQMEIGGRLPSDMVEICQLRLKQIDLAIENNSDQIYGDQDLHADLQEVMQCNGVVIPEDTSRYQVLQSEYKHA